MVNLPDVTLECIDCLDLKRAEESLKISMHYATFGSVKLLTSIDPPERISGIEYVKIPPIKSIQEYSKFMVKNLVKYIDTNYVLCTQWDAWILNPDAWTDEFYNYDYCGAPWWFNDDRNVGNGAFSLRSKKFLEVTSQLRIRNFNPEDLILCRTYRNHLVSKGIKFAPENLASRFSFEGNAKYGSVWNGSTFGFHDLEMSNISSWQKPNIQDEGDFHIIYRYCDKNPNTRLEGVTKRQCLYNFVSSFSTKNMTIIADNCDDTDNLKHLGCKIIETNVGNAESLKKAFEMAMTYDDDDIVYFVEDDFLHLDNPVELIKEGLEKADYVSLYFHPDKLEPGPNPYIGILGETCNVFRTKNSIWKTTNSTVQTFACRVRTLKEDKDILWKYNFEGSVPDSFRTFIELGKKGRTLVHPIPGRSTHCHSPWESPFIDWKKIAEGYKYEERYFRS